MRSLLFVCLSFIWSVCEHDNCGLGLQGWASIAPHWHNDNEQLSMITHKCINTCRPNMVGMVTRADRLEVIKFWCWSKFGCGSEISFSFSLTIGNGHFIRHMLTHQGRHCSNLGRVCALWVLVIYKYITLNILLTHSIFRNFTALIHQLPNIPPSRMIRGPS